MKKAAPMRAGIAIAAVFAAFLFLYLATESPKLPINEQLLWLFGFIYYLLVLFFFVKKQFDFYLKFGTIKKVLAGVASVVIAFALMASPLTHYNTLLQANNKVVALQNSEVIIVKPLGSKSMASSANNVTICQLQENGNNVGLDSFPHPGGWSLTNDQLTSTGSPHALHIPLVQHWLVSLSFYKTDSAGRVAVTFLGKTRWYDLYSATPSTFTIPLNDYYPPTYAKKPLVLRLFYYGTFLLVWLFPVFGLIILLFRKGPVLLHKIK